MSRSPSLELDDLLLELFQMLRKEGMALTMDQYDLLRQALETGYGWGGWDDLKRICRLVWVKPSPNYDATLFDRTFDRFIQIHRPSLPLPEPKRSPGATVQPSDLTALPQVPPRRMPSSEAESRVKVPVAAKITAPGSSTTRKSQFHLTPTDFPISVEDIKTVWRSLRRKVRQGTDYEPDVEATIARIEQEGFSDVILRPVQMRRAELLVLIDDSAAMTPFLPALQPFIRAIEEHHITPARMYRFRAYPDDYLFDWKYPAQAEPLTLLLPRLHRNRTVVIIISDAGAATRSYSPERIDGVTLFLLRLASCVRQIIWLNPLPIDRWEQTSAWTIANHLNGRMIPLEPASLQATVRQPVAEQVIKR